MLHQLGSVCMLPLCTWCVSMDLCSHLMLQLKDVTEQIGHLTEAITAASAAVGESGWRVLLALGQQTKVT